jgi:hypothetical protein
MNLTASCLLLSPTEVIVTNRVTLENFVADGQGG